jgi:hypothetical protein
VKSYPFPISTSSPGASMGSKVLAVPEHIHRIDLLDGGPTPFRSF